MKRLLLVAVLALPACSGIKVEPYDVGPYQSQGAALHRACYAVTLSNRPERVGDRYASVCEVR